MEYLKKGTRFYKNKKRLFHTLLYNSELCLNEIDDILIIYDYVLTKKWEEPLTDTLHIWISAIICRGYLDWPKTFELFLCDPNHFNDGFIHVFEAVELKVIAHEILYYCTEKKRNSFFELPFEWSDHSIIKRLVDAHPFVLIEDKVQLCILSTCSFELFDGLIKKAPIEDMLGSVFYFCLAILCRDAEYLADLSLTINLKDKMGRFAPIMLKLVCITKDCQKLERVLKLVNNPNMQWDDTTSLHYAIKCKSVDMTRLLIMYGANLDIRDPYGKTPLEKASDDMKAELADLECIICYEPAACIKTNCCVAQYCINCTKKLAKIGRNCAMCRQRLLPYCKANFIVFPTR